MNIIKKIFALVAKFIRWYIDPFPGKVIYRAEPITTTLLVITVLGVSLSAFSAWRGGFIQLAGYDIGNTLYTAADGYRDEIKKAHQEGHLDSYEYRVALERIDQLEPIFHQYANAIIAKGEEAGTKMAYEALLDLLYAIISPVGSAGEEVGTRFARYGGVFVDTMIPMLLTGQTSDLLEIGIWDIFAQFYGLPFEEEERALQERIREVLGFDADSLFAAHIRFDINRVRHFYNEQLNENPCNPDSARALFLRPPYKFMVDMNVYGEEMRWATYDEYLDWIIDQARTQNGGQFSKTWEGTWEGTFTATTECMACIPPEIKGEIVFTVDLETCVLEGSINGVGEGTHTIKLCSGDVPTEEEKTAYGFDSFSGEINGEVDALGNITFEVVTVEGEYKVGWVGEKYSEGSISRKYIITGSLDWDGIASGDLKPDVFYDSCNSENSWEADLRSP